MPRLLLIDDDPVFGRLLSRTAENLNLDLDYVESVDRLGFTSGLAEYDIIIVDEQMDAMTGLELAAYMPAFYPDKTMILISSHDVTQHGAVPLPPSLSAFVHKEEGCYQVLKQALAAYADLA